MKVFAIIFAAVFAIGAALPADVPVDVDTKNTRLVTDAITSIVEQLSDSIKERGLDPLLVERVELDYNPLPVANLLELDVLIENLASTGLSNIVINNLSFGILTQRLTYDISIPAITISVENGQLRATVLQENFSASGSGEVVIRSIGVRGTVRVNVGIISGISIRDLVINFYLGSIDSNITTLNILGYDLAAEVNYFIEKRLYEAIVNSTTEINELLEAIVWGVINDM